MRSSRPPVFVLIADRRLFTNANSRRPVEGSRTNGQRMDLPRMSANTHPRVKLRMNCAFLFADSLWSFVAG